MEAGRWRPKDGGQKMEARMKANKGKRPGSRVTVAKATGSDAKGDGGRGASDRGGDGQMPGANVL